jgi:uncharacterized protein (TIGR02452 family)
MADSIVRVSIWKDTKDYCERWNLIPERSIKYTTRPTTVKQNVCTNTRVRVLNIDCLECAMKLKNYNPVVLNLADDCFPGGAVDLGSGAQEESIFRRTDIYRTLNHHTGYYPLKNIDTVYSPFVHIIKNPDGTYIDRTHTVSIISAPALRMPTLSDGHLTEKDTQLLEDKIRMILDIAYVHKHKVVILGAMGCGAWRNPPEDVASCFKRVIGHYMGCFHAIVFAVLEVSQRSYLIRNRDVTRSNYAVFKEILESPSN